MSTIEDRLFADAASTNSQPDWDNVVERADQRITRSRNTSRAIVGSFALLLVGVLLTQRGSSIETAPTPPVATPDDSSTVAPWSETSPVVIILRAALVWGTSALVAATSFFASPRDFRAPFLIPRISRLTATAISVALWNALLLAVTGVLMLTADSSFVTAMHGHAAFIEIVSVVLIAVSLSMHVIGTFPAIWYLTAVAAAASLIGPALGLLDVSGSDERPSLMAIGAHVLVGGLIAWIPWVVYRHLGWRLDSGRLSRETWSHLTLRQIIAAVLMFAGMLTVTVGLSQPLVLRSQLADVLPTEEGHDWRIDHSQHPLFARDAPSMWADDQRRSTTFLDEGQSRVVDQEAEREELQALLEPLGFESPRFDRSDAQTATEQELLEIIRAIRDLARRPRADSYEGIVIDLSKGAGSLNFSVENPEAFIVHRTVRNIGMALVLAGVVVLWSETAISRYQRGPRSWTRQPRAMERIGWTVVWATVLGVMFFATGRLFTPELDRVGRDFWGLLVASGFAVWFGMWLLTPKPPPRDGYISNL